MAKIIVIAERCKSCGYCVKFCPKEVLAIGSAVNSKGYEIAEAVADALTLPSDPEPSLEDIIEADRSTRAYIRERYALA